MVRLALCAALFAPISMASADPLPIRFTWIVVPGEIAPIMNATGATLHDGHSYVGQPVHFQASTPMITALATGEIDLALLGFSSLGIAVENAGLGDLEVVLDDIRDGVEGYYSVEYMALNDGPVKTVSDLKGRIVAVNAAGSVLDVPLRMMLRRNGLEAGKDVTVIEIAPPNMGAVLLDCKADLAPMVIPFSLDPNLRAKAHTVFVEREAMQGTTEFAFYVARKSFLDKNRAAVVDFIEDYLRALHWFYDPANRTATLKIVADFTKLPPERFANWVYTDSKDMYRDPAGAVDAKALQRNLDADFDTGFMKDRLDVVPHIDMSLVEEANHRLAKTP